MCRLLCILHRPGVVQCVVVEVNELTLSRCELCDSGEAVNEVNIDGPGVVQCVVVVRLR